MTAPSDFSGYRAPHSEHPYRAHPFEPPKLATHRPNVQRRPLQPECHACHREGHVANDCPIWKDRCYRCHKEGHASNTCTLPDKRRKHPAATNQQTKTITNENLELARALTEINNELREINARLRPNWAWRTLPPFRERKTKKIPPQNPPEELGVTKPKIELPKPPEPPQPPEEPKAPQRKPPEEKQRTDMQGCAMPPNMHTGDHGTTVPLPQPNRPPQFKYDTTCQGFVIKTPTPSDDEEDTRIREQELQQGDYDDEYDVGYDSDLWRQGTDRESDHDHCPTGTDPFSRAIALAHKNVLGEPKPPTEQQQQPKKRHAKQRRRKK